MSEGPKKVKAVVEQKRLTYRVALLGDQQLAGTLGVVARFKRRYELNCLALALTENAALVAEVTARRATL